MQDENSAPDFRVLVPELSEWNEGKGIGVDDWICCVGSFEHAIGYTRLFWPEFLVHDEAVFFARGFSAESYDGFMRQAGGDRRAVERVMNHQHLLTLFGNPSLSPSRQQLVYLGDILQQMWTTKLRRDFPGRCFRVTLYAAEDSDMTDLEITFDQVPEAG